MRRRLAAWALVLVSTLSLGACVSATPRDHAGVVLRIEKVRAHLLAAARNAQASRWDLAAAHAAHPAEDMQPVGSALAKRDPQAEATLRHQLSVVRDAVAARDVDRSIEDADALLAAAARTVAGDLVDEAGFRAAVGAQLLAMVAAEYSEAVVEGRLRNEAEYQDAYSLLTRSRALLLGDGGGAIPPRVLEALAGLALAMREIDPPTSPVPAERVDALVDDARGALLETAGAAYATSAADDLAPLLDALDTASAALAAGNAYEASLALTAFRGTWTQVEGAVKVRSAETYARVEDDMTVAIAALETSPQDRAASAAAIVRMRAGLAPLVETAATYGVFDAALILLREGVEALLVVAALLAFLTKTGNGSKRIWIWAGSGAGILASVVVAIVITVAFSASASAGADREILEGATGIFAAAMLVYMSWWLHSKGSLASWQRYIREKTGTALAGNSLLGLSLIAFLAVFREGAETALFYLGMAGSIALWDLVLGLLVATVTLVAIAVLVLSFGMRIPIRPFFLGTSVLVYYLALKFAGTGIHALQVAGAIPASPRSYLPDLGIVGAFPTIETTLVQSLLLALTLAWLILHRRAERLAEAAGSVRPSRPAARSR